MKKSLIFKRKSGSFVICRRKKCVLKIETQRIVLLCV